MKAMKNIKMNRMLGSLKRRPRDSNSEHGSAEFQQDTPEANAAQNVRLFCESGGPNGSGEEVLYLPTIVEAAESSPEAAKQCAVVIRKFLGGKDNFSKPYVQYNAVMLIRILADNPGKTFTRNVDAKFVEAVKELLRVGKDPSVRQIVIETLDTFQREKQDDEGLAKLNEMWQKESERIVQRSGLPRQGSMTAPVDSHSQNYFARNHHSRHLPNPIELASRIEEARTSAKLLSQVVQSTPPSEVPQNELIREFADRCQSASRSIQAYMIAENPPPDNATMETLIDTSEQLSKAINQHQRALLKARTLAGSGNGQSMTPPQQPGSGFKPPPGPPPNASRPVSTVVPSRKALSKKTPQIPPPGDYAPNFSDDDEAANPFEDPEGQGGKGGTAAVKPPFPQDRPPIATGQFNDRLGIEPYHPGFKETPSYVGRQDSSVGKVTMHAAAVEPDSPIDENENEDESTADRYGVAPATKAPIYRY